MFFLLLIFGLFGQINRIEHNDLTTSNFHCQTFGRTGSQSIKFVMFLCSYFKVNFSIFFTRKVMLSLPVSLVEDRLPFHFSWQPVDDL